MYSFIVVISLVENSNDSECREIDMEVKSDGQESVFEF